MKFEDLVTKTETEDEFRIKFDYLKDASEYAVTILKERISEKDLGSLLSYVSVEVANIIIANTGNDGLKKCADAGVLLPFSNSVFLATLGVLVDNDII